MAPTSEDFRAALDGMFGAAETQGLDTIEVVSGQLHRAVGGYPGPGARMPTCCGAMRNAMRDGDHILDEPPSGHGASLRIRYQLPRGAASSDLVAGDLLEEALLASSPASEIRDWRAFEAHAQGYFSRLWGVPLRPGSVQVGGVVPWKFDLVSEDGRFVGDAKWYKNIPTPAAKWQAIAEYIWLLQRVRAEKVFMVFGRDAEVAERYLQRVRPLTAPVEFYFLDAAGHRRL